MLYLRKVHGKSMQPTLRPGQYVIVNQSRNFDEGDVVVAIMNKREVIKRIHTYENGKLFLLGDNPDQSTDSRQLGKISDNRVLGVVLWPRVSTRKKN